MRVPGWKAAALATRWTWSRITGGALILGYHRVATPAHDPYGICVSPRNFEEQMDVLRTAAVPVALASLWEGLRSRSLPRRSVVVTFDDGYADVVRHAVPVLERRGIPATVFVVSGSLGQRFWWDELAGLVLEGPPAARVLTLQRAAAHLPGGLTESSDLPGHALQELWPRFLALDPARRRGLLDAMHAAAGTAPDGGVGDEALTAADAARLARAGLVTIGSHTVTHPPLGMRSESEQREELATSRRLLEEVTGDTVREVSYPHGSIGRGTKRLARDTGYRLACESRQAVAGPATDPFALPRFWVPDWGAERFARWLHWWRT
jgi:peptidoglycan/xylan/chitin deacetylase (PgdA/CDA1 family)